MKNRIHELLHRNLQEVFGEGDAVRRRVVIDELYTEDCLLEVPTGRFVGREALDKFAGDLRATHPHYHYTPHGEPQALPDAGRLAWGSGARDEAPAYTGLDVIVVRDGRIAALYVFLDSIPSKELKRIMTSTQTDAKEYSYFAGNEWRKAADNQFFEVHEPYSGKLFARVPAGTRADGRAAVDAAAKAYPGWAATTPAERARLFLRAAEIVRRRRSEIAEILARETGSTISFATFQQDLVAATLQQVAGWVYLPKGEVLETNAPGSHSIGVRRPLGVVASFTPWNGANVLSWRAVISPVAAGNTVVVKPSEFAPVSAGVMLAEVAEEAGFPAGVINVVTHAPGAAGAIADEFFDRPEVRVINLIGGVKTARMLAERAGKLLKRTVMELGGFNPMIILDDVDMDYAVRTATFGSFFHQGQICLNTRRIIVQRKIYEEFLARFAARTNTLPAGDPLDPKTIIGPIITQDAVKMIDSRVKEAVAKGAKARTGAKSDGQIYYPTILTDVPLGAAIANEETFGPVVMVEAVDSPDDAVAAANRTMYGLTSSILSGDTYKAFEMAPKVLAGIVNVNSPTVNDEIHAPMGGVRDSGWGRTGPRSLDDFSDVIWINSHSGQSHYPF